MRAYEDALRVVRSVGAAAPRPGELVVDDRRGGRGRGLDRAARRAWLETLSRGSAALEPLLQFALLGPEDGFTAGAALNSALLAAAGRRAIVRDEDVDDARLFAPPKGPIAGSGDPTALEVFTDEYTVAGPAAAPLDDHPEARVQCLGLAGDSGMRSSAPYLLRGEGWLRARAERWPQIAESRTVLRAAPSTTPGAMLMSACLRLDLRDFVPPPLLPVLRNTDGLWGRHLAEQGQPALHLPAAAFHRPKPEARTDRQRAIDDLFAPRTSDLLSLLPVAAWPHTPEAWPARLLGPWRAHLERLALRLDDARRACPRAASALRSDLEVCLRRLHGQARRTPRPVDLPPAEAWARLCGLANRLLALRDAWPEIWSRARGCPPPTPK